MKKFYIETYGCQMNVAESNAMEALLKGAFWAEAPDPEAADLVIINTCSVRKSAENRIWGRLGFYKALKSRRAATPDSKPLLLVLAGCMAERIGDDIKRENPHVDVVLPLNDKLKILSIVGDGGGQDEAGIMPNSELYTFTSSYYKDGEYSSYVPIMNGCNNFCTYCIVPYVRGREVSRPVEDVLDEVRRLGESGVREITLLGQNVNSYNHNGIGFPELLRRVTKAAEEGSSIRWIRFDSPHPKDFSDDLIAVIKEEPLVAKHLHIPMQSGSTRVLREMNRRYTREMYLSLIAKIKAEIPDVTFAVDVMTGFPGETLPEFEETLSAMEEMGPIEAYMYYYNPREGTRAADYSDQIPDEEKQRRLSVLIEKQLERARRIKEKRTGFVRDVLVTGYSRDDRAMLLGRDEHNEMVAFTPLPGSKASPGGFSRVRFMLLNGNTFVGEEV